MHWENFSLCLTLLLIRNTIFGHEDNVFRCKDTDLVSYSLVFETHWTRRLFPKQYPANRPPAHWSKMIGRYSLGRGGPIPFAQPSQTVCPPGMTHDDNFVLFRIGEIADEQFKTFAETGKTEALGGRKKDGVRYVLDEFSSASIKTGAGKTQVNFFADGNHSLVSLAVKIIPSPDWFVGVDSLPLCVEGNWLDSVTVEASPIDAGTDSGFTFTAPNWETEPQERISKITSKWPKHPANSFYYPKLSDLPVIATFHITKKKLYELRKRVEIKESEMENSRKASSSDSIYLLDNNSMERGKYRKYKRRKYKKHSEKQMRKTEEK